MVRIVKKEDSTYILNKKHNIVIPLTKHKENYEAR